MGQVTGATAPKAGFLSRWAKIAVISVAGTGLAGNEVVTHMNQYDQSRQIERLTSDLNSRMTLDQVMRIVKNVSPSTVRVEGPRGLGSGVVIFANNNRYILTNGHVVQNNSFQPGGNNDSTNHIVLYNGTDFRSPIEFDAAPVLLSNGQRAFSPPEEHDFALLQIPANIVLPPNIGIRIRDLTKNPVRVGEPAIAIGNPFGQRDSVTFGIISHTDRKADGLNLNHHFQTDAPINPGNSGGGLFDMQGRLIGINTYGFRGGDGIGGSIRIDEIARILKEMGVNLGS